MSFTDWYHTDKNDPNGRSATGAGAQTGMMIGSLFGPVGAGIGTVVGGAFGAIFGSNSGRKRARREATKQSYNFGSDLFTYAGETRTQITKEYDTNLSIMQSRVAASGGNVDEAMAIQKGKLVKERDSQFEDLEVELDAFRAGPNYEWLRKDHEKVTGVTGKSSGSYKNDGRTTTFTIGGTSRVGKEAYTEAQRKKMQTFSSTKTNANDFSSRDAENVYREYAAKVAPSLEMYEKRVFGDEAAVKEYEAYVDKRIDSANEWYEGEKVKLNAREAVKAEQQRKFQERGNN